MFTGGRDKPDLSLVSHQCCSLKNSRSTSSQITELVERLFSARDTSLQPSTKLSNRENKVTGQPTIHLNVSRKTKNKNKNERIEKGRKNEWREIREGRGYGLHIPKKNKNKKIILLLFFLSEWREFYCIYIPIYRYRCRRWHVYLYIYIYIHYIDSYHGRRDSLFVGEVWRKVE